jgi:hypothetical protein
MGLSNIPRSFWHHTKNFDRFGAKRLGFFPNDPKGLDSSLRAGELFVN